MKRKILYAWSSNFKPSRQTFLYKIYRSTTHFHAHSHSTLILKHFHTLTPSFAHSVSHLNTGPFTPTHAFCLLVFFSFFKLIQFDWLPLCVYTFFLFQRWCCFFFLLLLFIQCQHSISFNVFGSDQMVVGGCPKDIKNHHTTMEPTSPKPNNFYQILFFVVFSLDCYTKNKLTFIFQFYHILWRLSVSK